MIVIGNKYTNNKDFVVLRGTITVPGRTGDDNSYAGVSIDFPDGFNKDNCVVVSFGLNNYGENRGYGYGDLSVNDARSWTRNSFPSCVLLGFPVNGVMKINITIEQYMTTEKTYEYQLVLMKIS